MTQRSSVLAIYYDLYRSSRKVGIRTRVGYGHERVDIRRFDTLKEFLIWLLKFLHEQDPAFIAKLATLDDAQFMRRGHRKRRYISPNRDTLYLQSQELAQRYSVRIADHWLASNIGGAEVAQIVKLAAEAAGVELLFPSKMSL